MSWCLVVVKLAKRKWSAIILVNVNYINILYEKSAMLYQHRAPDLRFDMIDVDPYGTCSPFLDGAVQAVVDGGKLIMRGVRK